MKWSDHISRDNFDISVTSRFYHPCNQSKLSVISANGFKCFIWNSGMCDHDGNYQIFFFHYLVWLDQKRDFGLYGCDC